MTSLHSPWTLERSPSGALMIINAAGDEVAQVFDEDAAKVICAAPEIIEAADAAYNSWSGGEPIDADMRNLGSALGMEPAP